MGSRKNGREENRETGRERRAAPRGGRRWVCAQAGLPAAGCKHHTAVSPRQGADSSLAGLAKLWVARSGRVGSTVQAGMAGRQGRTGGSKWNAGVFGGLVPTCTPRSYLTPQPSQAAAGVQRSRVSRSADGSELRHLAVDVDVAARGGVPTPPLRIRHDSPPQLLPPLGLLLEALDGAVQGCIDGRQNGSPGWKAEGASPTVQTERKSAGAAARASARWRAVGGCKCDQAERRQHGARCRHVAPNCAAARVGHRRLPGALPLAARRQREGRGAPELREPASMPSNTYPLGCMSPPCSTRAGAGQALS